MKLKKCKECKQPFTPERPLQYLCSPKCAYERARQQRMQKERKENIAAKNEIKTSTEWKADLQQVINKIVRLIDKGRPCIATGNYQGKMNAGHYISVKANPTIRFHLDNIHIQSEHSNSWKGGDTLRYQKGIIDIYGFAYLEYMNSLQSTPEIHITIDEIKVAIKKARAIARDLEKLGLEYSTNNRVLMRKKFNQQIGIYA